VDFKHLGFEFKKLKNEEKSLKIFHDLLSLMVSIVFANFIRFSIICGQYKLKKNKKDKNRWPSKAHLGPTIGGGGSKYPQKPTCEADPHFPSARPPPLAPVRSPVVRNRSPAAVYRGVGAVSRAVGGSKGVSR
jgi:hypothetical protein